MGEALIIIPPEWLAGDDPMLLSNEDPTRLEGQTRLIRSPTSLQESELPSLT